MLRAMTSNDASQARARFAAIAGLPDDRIDVAEAALWIAAEARPQLDVARYRGKLVDLANRAAGRLAPVRGTADRVTQLVRFLYDDERLRGNEADYYDPRNSWLCDVLDRRLGIPITLSIVWVDVARRRVDLTASCTRVAADCGDAITVDREVAAARGRSGAVDQRAAADYQIVHGSSPDAVERARYHTKFRQKARPFE